MIKLRIKVKGTILNLSESIKELFSKKINKKIRIILLIVYALIMFLTIQIEINTIGFILLFAVAPITIYFYVKTIFPK